MEILKFTVSSNGAFFKKPHVNTNNLSYSHIHKCAILGMLGAIIGIEKEDNVTKNGKDVEYGLPSYYKELSSIKVSIVPHKPQFTMKDNILTETTGLFNDGSNLLETYVEIVNPKWDIYILEDNSDYYRKIRDYILNNKTYYIPYLGKNHFLAEITNASVLEGVISSDYEKLDSIFNSEDFYVDEDEEERKSYLFKEFAPIGINHFNQYDEKPLAFCNYYVGLKEDVKNDNLVICCDNKNLYFI